PPGEGKRGRLPYGRLHTALAALLDQVGQAADARDVDVNQVVRGEAEVVGRHDAGAGQEDHAVGETVLAAQPGDEVTQGAGHLRDARAPLEDLLAAPLDGQADRHL